MKLGLRYDIRYTIYDLSTILVMVALLLTCKCLIYCLSFNILPLFLLVFLFRYEQKVSSFLFT